MPGKWRRPGFRPFLRTQNLAVLPPDITTTLRAPVYSRLSPPSSIIPGVVVAANLLVTVLASGPPFNNSQLQAAPRPLATIRPAEPTRNLLLTLPPGSLPFAKADWPIIQPTPRVSVSFESRNLLAPLLAPPFGQTDWPIQPKLTRLREADATRNVLLTLPPGSLPFSLNDWLKPQPPPRSQANDPLNLLTNTLASTVAPFAQGNWPILPQAALLEPADATPNLLLRLPPGSLPLNQSNWPTLQAAARFILASDPENLLSTLLAPTTAPFIQRDWALVPQFVTLRPAEPIPDTLLTLPPGRLAFSQTSWPIQPRMAVHRLPDAPRNITINLPAPQVAAGGIKHKRKWRRT